MASNRWCRSARCSPAACGSASDAARARITARNSESPSRTNSIAGASVAGVSWATWAITQAGGSDTSPASASSSPRRSAKSDDLPLPFAPTRPTFWPACTVSAAPSSSRLLPRASVTAVRRIMHRAPRGARHPAATPARARRGSHGASCELVVVIDDDGRVIGEAAVLVARHRASARRDARRRHLVVDAPADILLPRLASRRPERVVVRLLVDAAEHVDEADLVEHAGQPGALFGQEARDLLVRAPIPQVDRLVGDIPVAAEDGLPPATAELQQMRQERFHETVLRCLPVRSCRPRRQVHARHGDLAEVRLEVPAFDVELGRTEAGGDLRLALGVKRHAGVALAPRRKEEAVRLARRKQGARHVIRGGLDLLEAHDVPGLHALEPARQALLLRRSDAVDVEGDDAHGRGGVYR